MRRVVLLAFLLLAPVAAAAEDVVGHRAYVVGRVVDAGGAPVAGAPVDAAFQGVAAAGACFGSRDERTGPRGDFVVCRHMHAIPDGARVVVTVAGSAREVPLDPLLRHAVANLQLAGASPSRDITGEREFGQTFRVAGRSAALLPRPEDSEGIPVNATPLGENVTARLSSGDTVLAEAGATPDEHGLYAIDLDVREIPAGTIVRVTNGRESSEAVASALYRRADLNLLRDLRLSEGQGDGAPGSETPSPLWLTVLAAATAAVAAPRAWRRRR